MNSQAMHSMDSSHQKAVTEFSLTEIYNKWFEVIRCDTPELVKLSQKLRYQVYCIETNFEDPDENPGGLETDDADEHALHSILIHKPSSIIAGTVRLITPEHGTPYHGLPSRQISQKLGNMTAPILPSHKTAEISRFSVSKEFRKRLGDGLYPANAKQTEEPSVLGRRALPSITLGLMRAIVEMTKDAQMTHVTAVVEPALVRLLQRLGIRFNRTGERVHYHGTRYPVYRDMTELLSEIYEQRPEIWHVITDSGEIWPLEGFRHRLMA
jgi:N-acyl amino acid synthase of PEP-CTERM/exosortase system